MRPILFHIGSYAVHAYGVMLLLAILAGIFVARHELNRRGLNGSAMYLIGAVAAISGVVGARIFFVIGYWGTFPNHWISFFDFHRRGLIFYGGLFLAIPCCMLVVRRMKLPMGVVGDAVGLAIPLSMAIGRVGCFLTGCCRGKPSGLPWAVTFPGTSVAVHPAQLYELLLDLAAFGFLLFMRKRVHRDWDIFLLYLAAYGIIRFTMEFFRFHVNPAASIFFQVVSLTLTAVSLGIFFYRRRRVEEPPEAAGG